MPQIDSTHLLNCIKINEKYTDYESLKADFIRGDKLITQLLSEYNNLFTTIYKNENTNISNIRKINQSKKENYKLSLLKEQKISSNNIDFSQDRLLNKTNLEKYNSYCKILDIKHNNLLTAKPWVIKKKVLEQIGVEEPIEELPNYDLMNSD